MIIDDHTMVRAAISHLIGGVGDIEVVAEADSGERALDKLRSDDIDAILCDIHMPGMGGYECLKRAHQSYPRLGLVALTAEADVTLARQVLESGVHAYVTKDADPEELINAIRKAALGQRFISSRIAQEIALQNGRSEEDPFEVLSGREQQVLRMILDGKNNTSISDALCVSPKTISTYRARIHEKLGVSTDIDLLRLAVKAGRTVLSA
ncbi:response regulator transcription factor [Guyparkeria hydrothermalis]|uniref:response regulator n=1 Tax=Guyparkeria hydrothermalis TaxID=923 RepID=UPI0020214A15|nr:response regulator transcription factor [Guyparkeria hydrothermalis]MCL7744542.1 response regulator transcription factor [Guyparkeria hydrothermalis]